MARILDQIVFAQLSDTHVGKRLMGNKFHDSWPRSGYNPHDDRLFEPLYVALEDARSLAGMRAGEPLYVVMGGDLTAGGTANDCALAAAVMFRRWRWWRE